MKMVNLMSKPRGLKEPVRLLTEYAETLGFEMEFTKSNHLKFFKTGHKPVFVSRTPSCSRGLLNAKSDLRRSAAMCAKFTA